jgi:hypothetical protein
MNKLNALAFGYAGAVISAACMLSLSVLAKLGLYVSAAEAMMQWHMFFNLSPVGIIGGLIEGALGGFILGYAFAWVYNKFA